MTGALSFARLLAMTILISHADAMGDLPHAIQRERKLLTHNQAEYMRVGRACGFTQKELAHQAGRIEGMLDALSYVMQADWCSRNDHPVPLVTADDVWRYVEEIAGR